MTSPVNVNFDLATTETKVIPLNRYGYPAYAVSVNNGSALVEGTLDKVNRIAPGSVNWFTLDDSAGAAMTAVIPGSGIVDVQETPIEAIRITATGATDGRVAQTGGS